MEGHTPAADVAVQTVPITRGEKAARRVAEMFPNTELVFVGKGRHYIQKDQPVAFGEALSDWFSRTA